MTHIPISKSRRGVPRLALAGALALSIGACDTNKIVAVDNPSSLRPEDLNSAAAIPALMNGTIRQFVGGYSGFGGDAFLSSSGAITDELYYGDTFTTRNAADKRAVQPPELGNISDNAFIRLLQTRFNARRAVGLIDQFTTPTTAATDSVNKAQMRVIEGYVYVTLSEGWCGAVPFSNLPVTGTIDVAQIKYGAPLTTAQMNDTAAALFSEGASLDATNNLAAVGRARALLNNGKFAEAAAAVVDVPTDYVFLLEHSVNTSDENNPIAALQQNGRWGVANLDGAQTSTGAALSPAAVTPSLTAPSAEGLPFRALRDPRVPWERRPTNGGNCFTKSIPCFWNDNYYLLEAPVPLASGVEARLIEAEAALQAGQPGVMLATLNALRADMPNLIKVLNPKAKQVFAVDATNPATQPLTDPGATLTGDAQFAARRDLLFRERALWLYATGHRQGDLRRLVRNYGLTSSQVFPSGPYFRGGSYGNDVAYPVPFNEQNNPSYNPSACVTTEA